VPGSERVMIVTLNRIDNVVVVDGRALSVDLSQLDKSISVVQWHEARGQGWVEYTQDPFGHADEYKPNKPITNFSEFVFAIAMWRDKASQIDNPPKTSVEALKEKKRTQWERSRRMAIFDGYESSALGSKHFYGGSPLDQIDMIASMVLQPDDWNVTIWCRDGKGTWAMRPHTRPQMQAAYKDGRAIIAAIHDKYAALLEQIEKARTPEALEAITLS